MPPRAPSATFTSLRATRDATRLARAILLDRVTQLAVVHCARCGRAIAAATDAPTRPDGESDRRLVCQICVGSQQVAMVLTSELPEPPLHLCIDEIEEWARAGLVEMPAETGLRPTPQQPPPEKFRRG